MGKVQSHMETKVFEDTPPWDLETIVSSTDLDEETANACWRVWIRHPLVKSGQLTKEAFCALLDIQGEPRHIWNCRSKSILYPALHPVSGRRRGDGTSVQDVRPAGP